MSNVRMADALAMLAEPITKGLDQGDATTLRRAIELAAAAWNIAVTEAREGPESASELVETIKRRTSIDDPKALDAFEELLRVFVTRKHELFLDDHRLVGDVAVIETPSGLRIQASHAAAR
jgi:hypothetical protein